MAAIAAFNDYLQRALGIRDNSLRLAINMQGLTDFDDFITLTEDDVEEICSNVRKPGGMIANPNLNAGIQNQPLVIANPGLSLGHIYEKRLKVLRYFMYHLQRTQRLPFDPVITTMNDLNQIYVLKEADKGEDDLVLPAPFQRLEQSRIMLENLDDYLYRKRGETGVPLSYVTRKEVTLPTIANDPGFGQPSYVEEMIRRAPHVGTEWQKDNLAVWNIIRHIAHNGQAWNWVSQFQRTGNGRDAYLALKTHYFGPASQERIRSQADAKLDGAFFDGRNRNFTFEHYCGMLNNAFADLEATGEVVDESRRLRCFLKGFKDPNLAAARAQIIATQSTGGTFEQAVNYVSQFIDQTRSLAAAAAPRNVSVSSNSNAGRSNSTSTGRGNGQRGNGQRARGRTNRSFRGGYGNRGRGGHHPPPPVVNAGQYLSDNDWANLTEGQREGLRNARRTYAQQNPPNRRGSTAADTRSVRQRVNPSDQSIGTELTGATSQAPTVPGSIYQSNIGAVMSRRQNNNNNGDQSQQGSFFS